MHTYVKKPPVNQRQAHEPQRPTNSQPRHIDKLSQQHKEMAALQRLAATCVRPQDQKIAQLKALAIYSHACPAVSCPTPTNRLKSTNGSTTWCGFI